MHLAVPQLLLPPYHSNRNHPARDALAHALAQPSGCVASAQLCQRRYVNLKFYVRVLHLLRFVPAAHLSNFEAQASLKKPRGDCVDNICENRHKFAPIVG